MVRPIRLALCIAILAVGATGASNGAGVAHAGNGKAKSRTFVGPTGVAIDSQGHVFVVNADKRIVELSSQGWVLGEWGKKIPKRWRMKNPWDIAADGLGNVYITDFDGNKVEKFTTSGRFEAMWPCPTGKHSFPCSGYVGGPFFRHPLGIAVDSWGTVYIADSLNSRIEAFDSHGTPRYALFDQNHIHPISVAVDGSGNIYTYDNDTGNVLITPPSGDTVVWPAVKSGDLAMVAADAQGQVYLSDDDQNKVFVFSHDGTLLSTWGSKGSRADQFQDPFDVAVGPDGNIYIADAKNNRIVIRAPDGHVLAVWK